VGVARACSQVKPSPEPRKVEGPDSRTKAKGGTGTTTRDIEDIPSGETRACPEILGKRLVHSGHSRVKQSPEPRKVEGPGSRTKAKGGTGTTILDILKDIPSGETRARPEILGKKHLVHSDNHGIGVSDPRVHEGPVVVGPDMKRDWSVKPSLAPRKVEGLSSIAMARLGTGNGTEPNLVAVWNTTKVVLVRADPNLGRKTWKGTVFTRITMVAAFRIRASAPRTRPMRRKILTGGKPAKEMRRG
jgi:hypothetical protein